MRVNPHKMTCPHCKAEFDVESLPAMDINANYICTTCAEGAARIGGHTLGHPDRWYFHAEQGLEEMTTGFYGQRAEARARILEMAAALWPNKPIIEE